MNTIALQSIGEYGRDNEKHNQKISELLNDTNLTAEQIKESVFVKIQPQIEDDTYWEMRSHRSHITDQRLSFGVDELSTLDLNYNNITSTIEQINVNLIDKIVASNINTTNVETNHNPLELSLILQKIATEVARVTRRGNANNILCHPSLDIEPLPASFSHFNIIKHNSVKSNELYVYYENRVSIVDGAVMFLLHNVNQDNAEYSYKIKTNHIQRIRFT